MKTLLTALFILSQYAIQAQSKPDTVAVLFIGNSYTYFNNLPAIVQTIAEKSGQPMYTDMAVIGGATLKRHWQDTAQVALKKLRSRHWDFVIMQDQSQLGLQLTPPANVSWIAKPDTFYHYARLWCQEIRKQNAQPCFTVTWARAYDASTQPLLTAAYATIAQQTKAILIPAGEIWQRYLASYKQPLLHQGDGSHPSQAGSFLTALCVLQSILPDRRLTIGYPISGLPVDVSGKVVDMAVHVKPSNQAPYTLYSSFNKVVLIGLSKQQQENLLSSSRQTSAISRSLLKKVPALPSNLIYH